MCSSCTVAEQSSAEDGIVLLRSGKSASSEMFVACTGRKLEDVVCVHTLMMACGEGLDFGEAARYVYEKGKVEQEGKKLELFQNVQ